MASDEAIRFALLCRSGPLPTWQRQTIERLLSVEGVILERLVQPPHRALSDRPGERIRRVATSKTSLWDAYNNGYVARRAASLQPVDCSDLFDGVETIEAKVERQGRFSEYFTPEVIEELQSLDLDFVLRFAYGIIRGDILSVARNGVWSFHHGDEEYFRGSPPAFWEVVDGAEVTGVLLQRLTDRLDGGIVLRKGWSTTRSDSYVRNTDQVHFAGSDFPAQVVRDVRRGAAEYLDAEPSSTGAAIRYKPTNRETLSFGLQQASSFVRRHVHKTAKADAWAVGRVDAPISAFLDPTFEPQIEWFRDKRNGHYLADPFAIERGDQSLALVEDFDQRAGKGSLALLDFASMTRTPVGAPFDAHASYPFTFTVDGVEHVAAQIAGEQGVRLLTWSGDHQLAEVGRIAIGHEILDPTIVQHGGRWWIFFTIAGARSLTELHIWHSHDLDGKWHPHPANPVKTDVRSARPAGTPFVHGGVLYRPAQNCATSYGGAVNLMRIDELTVDGFVESVVGVIAPGVHWPYPDGIHTLAGVGDVTYIDARRSTFNRYVAARELSGRLRKIRSK